MLCQKLPGLIIGKIKCFLSHDLKIFNHDNKNNIIDQTVPDESKYKVNEH